MSSSLNHFQALETKTGYVFKNRQLMEAALTHASLQQKKGNYERLEFLGDRVLGLAVAETLYKIFPHENEGDLAKRHAALVQEKTLVKVAGDIALADYLQMSVSEKRMGGLTKDAILADAVEALIGAVFIDGGFAPASAMVGKLWQDVLHVTTAPPEDPKTKLQEWVQARGLPLPIYSEVSRQGADHQPIFEIEVSIAGFAAISAKAASKRMAEKQAAEMMLQKIGDKK